MLPDTGTGCDESSGGVPVDVSDTIVIGSIHELRISCEVLPLFRLIALEVHIKKVHVKALLRVDGSYNDKSALG